MTAADRAALEALAVDGRLVPAWEARLDADPATEQITLLAVSGTTGGSPASPAPGTPGAASQPVHQGLLAGLAAG
jgi:hypothetical protein